MQITINININDRIINFFKNLMTKKNAVAILSVSVIATTLYLYAAPIAKQFTFTDGSTASASEVNANFDDLFTKVNELDTTVTGLQTGANPVYGNESGAGNDSVYVDASGNVGIGTASPDHLLVVADGDSSTPSNINVQIVAEDSGAAGIGIYSGNTSEGMIIFGNSSDNADARIAYNHSTRKMAFRAGNVETTVLDSAGNVGIGTTSPGARLHIKGIPLTGPQLTIEGGSSGDDPEVRFIGTRTGARNWSLYGSSGVSGNEDNFRVYDSSGGGDRLVIDSSGNVGIGTTSPGYPLHVNGIVAGDSFCDSTCQASDIRLKQDIQPFKNVLEKLSQLQPVTFQWKDHNDANIPKGNDIGLIAQDVEKVFPDWVTPRKDGYKRLPGIQKLPIYLLQAIKELKSQNDALKDENKALRKQNYGILSRISALEVAKK